jgi:Tetratricopeptide repeat
MDEHRKSLAITLTKLGDNDEATATAYGCIGSALVCQGDYDGALVEFKKALQIIRQSVLGENHQDTAVFYN